MNINSRTSKINFTGFKSGAVASFTGLRVAPMIILANIDPIQEGSGDPSLNNVRPIIPRDNIIVTANSVDHNIDLKGSIYGGKLNITNGQLLSDKVFVRFDGTENWTSSAGGNNKFFVNNIGPFNSGVGNVGISNEFVLANIASTTSDIGFRVYNSSGYNSFVVGVRPNGVANMTTQDFKNLLSESPMELVYTATTPTIIQLSPEDISQIIGSNSISSDCGNVEVYYVTI